MDDILATNQLKVQALCPVHIGTGDILRSIDFVYANNTVLVLDDAKVLNWVAADRSGKLADLFVAHAESGQPIGKFLRAQGKDPAELGAYALKANLSPQARLTEVRLFMKSIQHRPYLAGSSLKGALRSSLLRGALLADPQQLNQADRTVDQAIEYSKGKYRRESGSGEVEATVFVAADVPKARYPNYDLNRVLVVHDSPPNPTRDLEVVDVQMLTVRTRGQLEIKTAGGANPISIYVEALRPKAIFTLDIAWQRNLLEGLRGASVLKFKDLQRLMVFLPEYCRAASAHIIRQEIDFYNNGGQTAMAGWFEARRDLLAQSSAETFILPLGWGSGYDPKTITDLLDKATFKAVADNLRNTRGLGRPGNNPDNTWLGPKLSPKSRKVVVDADGQFQPVGWVAVRIIPAAAGPGAGWWDAIREELADEKPSFPEQEIIRSSKASPAQSDMPQQPSSVSRQVKGAPAASGKVESQPPAPKPQIIKQFNRLPLSGECFEGEVFEVRPDGSALLEISGLETRFKATAYLPPSKLRRYRDGEVVECQVVAVEPDPNVKGGSLVRCQEVE